MSVGSGLIDRTLGFSTAPLGTMFGNIPVVEAAAAMKVEITIGGPYGLSVLVGRPKFEVQRARPEILTTVERMATVVRRHQVPIKAAALRFALAHPASSAVAPVASRPECISEDIAARKAWSSGGFRHEVRPEGLVAADAPSAHRPATH